MKFSSSRIFFLTQESSFLNWTRLNDISTLEEFVLKQNWQTDEKQIKFPNNIKKKENE